MSSLLPNAQRYLNDNGDAESGLLVYTYQAGTLTDKATYTDFGQTTAHTNPIVLDASGYPPSGGQVYGSGSYRIIVKDSGGSTLSDRDGVVFDSVASDENGNYVLGGALPSDIYVSGVVVAYPDSAFDIFENSGSVGQDSRYHTKNIYLTDAETWKVAGNPSVSDIEFSVKQMSDDGQIVTYQGTAAVDSIVTITDYETSRIDNDGHISYKGSEIPDNASDIAESMIFTGDGAEYTLPSGTRGQTSGCFLTDVAGNFEATRVDDISILIMSSSGTYTHYTRVTSVIGTSYTTGDFTATVIA